MKRILKFTHHSDSLFNNKPILQSKNIFKSEAHNVHTE